MIDLIPARSDMTTLLELQPAQQLMGQAMTEDSLEAAIRGGLALAAVRDGKLLGLGGIFTIWPGRGMAWALLAGSLRESMLGVHRIMQRGLETTTYARVEAYVADVHEEGHRWMEMLGFEMEGMQRKFWQDRDYALYAKVR